MDQTQSDRDLAAWLLACRGRVGALRSAPGEHDDDGVGVRVTVEGDLDLRGTLGTPDVPVGFQAIRLGFDLTDHVPADRLEKLKERTEKYCVVLQTLAAPPVIGAEWTGSGA